MRFDKFYEIPDNRRNTSLTDASGVNPDCSRRTFRETTEPLAQSMFAYQGPENQYRPERYEKKGKKYVPDSYQLSSFSNAEIKNQNYI